MYFAVPTEATGRLSGAPRGHVGSLWRLGSTVWSQNPSDPSRLAAPRNKGLAFSSRDPTTCLRFLFLQFYTDKPRSLAPPLGGAVSAAAAVFLKSRKASNFFFSSPHASVSVSNHCYENTACQGDVVGVAREWRSSEGCVAVVNGWEHTPNTPWWLIPVSLFGYRAHRRSTLPSDGHVEAHVGTADGFMPGLNRFNKKGNFRSTSVSMAGSSRSRKCYVNVFFF